jgi:hypothetical protein
MNEYEVDFIRPINLAPIETARVVADSTSDAMTVVGNTYDVFRFYGVREVNDDQR